MNSNKFFNTHLYRVLFVVIYGLFTSCEDFVDVEVPNHKIVSKTVFNNDNTANSALVGIYNELFRSYLSGGGRNLLFKNIDFFCKIIIKKLNRVLIFNAYLIKYLNRIENFKHIFGYNENDRPYY